MNEFLTENWPVILPLVGAAVALFFPQLKPIIDAIVKPKKPGPDGEPAPIVVPVIDPVKRPGLALAIQAAMILIDHFAAAGNKTAEAEARQAAKSLFDPSEAEAAK